jgi:hypothetical protein
MVGVTDPAAPASAAVPEPTGADPAPAAGADSGVDQDAPSVPPDPSAADPAAVADPAQSVEH